MKRLLMFALVALSCIFPLQAQTAEEIVAKMDEVMGANAGTDNVYMIMDMKIPILGTISSKVYTMGEKMKVEVEERGVKGITWEDGVTEWTYDSKKNTITIKNAKPSTEPSESEENMAMLTGITEGYDVKLKKETATEWVIQCRKSKSNKEKDDPKNMELIVNKANYMPKSLSAKVSGITIVMRDISFNVTEKDVTFDPAAFPGVEIVDER